MTIVDEIKEINEQAEQRSELYQPLPETTPKQAFSDGYALAKIELLELRTFGKPL